MDDEAGIRAVRFGALSFECKDLDGLIPLGVVDSDPPSDGVSLLSRRPMFAGRAISFDVRFAAAEIVMAVAVLVPGGGMGKCRLDDGTLAASSRRDAE